MLLVAEVEEGEREDRQEESEEVKGGSHVEETTTTWMAMMMVVSGVRTRLELEPNLSVDEVHETSETLRASVELFVEVHDVKRHAIGDVLCRPVVNVVIGVHIVVLFRPAYCCPLCRPNSHTVLVHPTIYP